MPAAPSGESGGVGEAAEVEPNRQAALALADGGGESTPAPQREDGQEFARLLEESEVAAPGQELEVGARVSGVVVKVEDENTFVDYGGRGEAVIRTAELRDQDGQLLYKAGDPLEAFVARTGAEVVLSRGLSREERQTDLLYKAYKAGMPVEGRVDAVNKWGLGVLLQGGVRGFCPISQVDTRYVENAEEYRGQTLTFKIIEFRHQGRDIVLSRRSLLEEEKDLQAQAVRAGLEKGAALEGKVTRLESFGAFVDLGAGIEGLVHVSEISHQRVGHPQEVLSVGQAVQVQVLRTKGLGKGRKERISLSMKALEKDPWEEIQRQYPRGKVLEGKVESLENYGAFVEVAPGLRGMIHVSEMAERRIGHPREVLSVGDAVRVVVLEVDARKRRLRLSIRQVESLEAANNLKEFRQRQKKEQEEAQSGNAMVDALRRARLIR
jgi:small subunit ribosomal protein S1